MAIANWVWKETAEVLGVVGIIAGITFLGFELRQNNELMSAQERFNRLQIVTEAWASWAIDGELTEIRVRAGTNEPLTEVEYRRVDGALMRVFLNLDWIYRELPEDSPEVSQIRVTQRRSFANDASYRRVWEDRKSSFSPEFVQWMEENVVSER